MDFATTNGPQASDLPSISDRMASQQFDLLTDVAAFARECYPVARTESLSREALVGHLAHFLYRSERYPNIFNRAAWNLSKLHPKSADGTARYAVLYNYVAWLESGGDQVRSSPEALTDDLLASEHRHVDLLRRDLCEFLGFEVEPARDDATHTFVCRMSELLAAPDEESRVGALLGLYVFAKLHIERLWGELQRFADSAKDPFESPFYVCHAMSNGPEKSVLVAFLRERSEVIRTQHRSKRILEAAHQGLRANMSWLDATLAH